MPIEIELLIAAWDNAKKNLFGGDGWNIDPESGEVITGMMADDLADLVADLDDKMSDLSNYYLEDAVTQFRDEEDVAHFLAHPERYTTGARCVEFHEIAHEDE